MRKYLSIISVLLVMIITPISVFATSTQENILLTKKQKFYSLIKERAIENLHEIKRQHDREKIECFINSAVKMKRKDVYNLKDINETESANPIQKIDNIVVGDMNYKNAILCDSNNKIVYNLDGKYKRFTSYVSVCDDSANLVEENLKGVHLKLRHPKGNVQFSVFADNVLLYFSSILNGDSLPEYIDVDVENKQKLEIVVENLDSENIVKSAWLEASLHKKETVNKPQNIVYKRKEGTFLYCNNPESIKSSDTLNNGKIIYREENVDGNISLFCEQNNSTNEDMYYAVVLKNRTEQDGIVRVYNKGMSKNWWTGLKWDENCWKEYKEARNDVIEIKAFDANYLIEPTKISQYNQYTGQGVINLAVKFNSDVKLDVEVVAFNEEYKNSLAKPADINGSYEGCVIRHEFLWGEARNYKGKNPNLPEQECILEWEVDDNTNISYLPVRYGNIDRAGWITHITKNKHISALEEDMYEFVDPNNLYFGPKNIDYSTMIANLGNWAITYKETIKIRNNSDNLRTADILFKNAFLNSGVIIIKPDGSIIKSADKSDNIKVIDTLELVPNEVTSYTLEYLLPACSVGGLAHYIKLN